MSDPSRMLRSVKKHEPAAPSKKPDFGVFVAQCDGHGVPDYVAMTWNWEGLRLCETCWRKQLFEIWKPDAIHYVTPAWFLKEEAAKARPDTNYEITP